MAQRRGYVNLGSDQYHMIQEQTAEIKQGALKLLQRMGAEDLAECLGLAEAT